MRRRSSPHTETGFTLVELMVALTVGGIALGAIYTVGAASTAHFREQQRVAGTQTSVRMAMAQLKKDFQRAGFLGTPSAGLAAESCAPPSNVLHVPGAGSAGGLSAISWFDESAAVPSDLNPAGDTVNTNVAVSDVVLMGNYVTSGEYGGVQQVGQDAVTISQNWQSFRRDFTDWYGTAENVFNAAVFTEAFANGRLVRIHTRGERHWFATISGVTPPAAIGMPVTVAFTGQPLPGGCNAQNGWIAPISFIRYFTANASDTASSGEEARFPDASGGVAQLRRREVDPTSKRDALLDAESDAIDDRSVLDYVVAFELTFSRRDSAGPNSLAALPATETEVNANPELLRSVTIRLAARTPVQDPRLAHDDPFTFRVFDDRPGATRVRTLTSEIFLPNIAFEGY